MARICDELRAERERQGLSLEAISESTKIAQRHLEALESGDYARLPGGVFRKGFLRGYLSALRLNAEVWVDRFDAELREAGLLEANAGGYEELAENIRRSRGLGLRDPDARLRWSGVVVMLLLLLVFGWCVWHFALNGHVMVTAGLQATPIRRWPALFG